MFGRPWGQFLSGTQIFSLSRAHVTLINFEVQFVCGKLTYLHSSIFLYRKGSYKIVLIAANGIGSEKESITVQITNVKQCFPPEVGILGFYSGKVSLKSYAYMYHSTHLGIITYH